MGFEAERMRNKIASDGAGVYDAVDVIDALETELAALKAENERLRADAERWQYLVNAISNRAEWEAIDEIFEAARIEQWENAVLDDEIDKVRQQEQGQG